MMDNLSAGDLAIEVSGEPPEPIQCVWLGKSNHRHNDRILTPYLRDLLTAAREAGVALEMHFEHLDHLNSSTITILIKLIQDAQEAGVRLVLVYDRGLKWQNLSFNALRVFVNGDGLFDLQEAAS